MVEKVYRFNDLHVVDHAFAEHPLRVGPAGGTDSPIRAKVAMKENHSMPTLIHIGDKLALSTDRLHGTRRTGMSDLEDNLGELATKKSGTVVARFKDLPQLLRSHPTRRNPAHG